MIWLKIQHVLDMTPGLTNKNKHCFLTQSGTKLKPIELGYTFHTSYKHSATKSDWSIMRNYYKQLDMPLH